MSQTNAPAGPQQLLTFVVGEDEYAVPVLRVREIIEQKALTPLPGTPAAVRGVLNLRGNVVPVVDLALKFGRPATVLTKLTCVVIVEIPVQGELAPFGLLTDAVRQVINAAPGQVGAVPSFGTPVHVDYLQGMLSQSEGKFILVLNIDRILSVDELKAAATAAQPAGKAVPHAGDQ